MAMDPPGHRLPVTARSNVIGECRNNYTRGSTHMSVRVKPIPDVTGIVRLVARAIMSLLITELVDFAGTIRGADSNSAELILQWFQQFLAEAFSRFDCQVRVIRDVGNAVELRNFAVEKIAQEEVL